MVSQTAIAATAMLQMWGKSFFLSQGESSPAPALGGTIFLVAILLLIWECNILPKHYRQRAPWIYAVAEILATVFVTELIIQMVWCTYERIAHRLVRGVCYRRIWCEFGLMAITTVVGALASLCVVVEVVCPARIKDSVGEILDILPVPEGAASLIAYLQDAHTYAMGAIYFSQLTREQRRLAVRAFELQLRNSKTAQDTASKEEQKLENSLQESVEPQENLEEEQSAELQENVEKKAQELEEDLLDLLDLKDQTIPKSEPEMEKKTLELEILLDLQYQTIPKSEPELEKKTQELEEDLLDLQDQSAQKSELELEKKIQKLEVLLDLQDQSAQKSELELEKKKQELEEDLLDLQDQAIQKPGPEWEPLGESNA